MVRKYVRKAEKAKVGRKPMSADGVARKVEHGIALTAGEKARIQALAEKLELSFAETVRQAVFALADENGIADTPIVAQQKQAGRE